MKVNKTQALLFMYDLLIEKGYFTKEMVMSNIDITNLTFLRYIQELRAYLANFDTSKELLYVSNGKYRLLEYK